MQPRSYPDITITEDLSPNDQSIPSLGLGSGTSFGRSGPRKSSTPSLGVPKTASRRKTVLQEVKDVVSIQNEFKNRDRPSQNDDEMSCYIGKFPPEFGRHPCPKYQKISCPNSCIESGGHRQEFGHEILRYFGHGCPPNSGFNDKVI